MDGVANAVLVVLVVALGIAGLLNWRASRRRQAAVLKAERLQHSILNALEDGVVVIDEHDEIVFSNPSAEEILGVPRAELGSGLRSWELLGVDGEPLAPEERPTAITARTGRPCSGVDVGLRRADGSLRWLRVSTQPLKEAPGEIGTGGPYSVVTAFTDVTDRRETLEALERSNAELAEFAYVASHDLSEPLRMVSSYLQLLRRRYHGQIDEDADEFIDFAVDGANRMRALIEDLLAYSRAGRGAEPRPVDVGLVVGDVLSSLAAAVADARARVHIGPLPIVLGDRVAIAQLLQNLVANALKFRRGRGARVWVSAEPEGAATWRFSVSDDGIGIDPRHSERVFKMFQRLHDRESFEGTGIGLAICRKIVERQGGRIWVEEREGGGSVFSFTLPAVPPPVEVPPAMEPAPEHAGQPA
jgi:PAS domain S-box-containing protein